MRVSESCSIFDHTTYSILYLRVVIVSGYSTIEQVTQEDDGMWLCVSDEESPGFPDELVDDLDADPSEGEYPVWIGVVG